MMERQYKDSGIEWIGRIPEEWETQRGKTLGDISHGVSFTPSDLRDKDEGVLILRASNVQNSQLDYQDNVYIPKSKIPIEKLLKKDDIVICGTNGSLALVGKSALVKEDMEASYGSFMLRMRTKKEPRFIHYQLTQIVDMYRGLFATTTINQLTISQLQNIIFVIPPLPEQQRIASYLDKKCGEIDALIALQEKMIAQLTEYKQAVITEAVTKGLDPNAKLVPSGIEWIGDVPKGWKVMPLKWILRNNLQYGANESGILYDESLPRYVRITDIHNNNLREDLQKQSLTEEQAQGYILENNDILFARSGGTVGKAFIFKSEYGRCAFAGYLIRAQIDEQCDAMFVYYYTQSSSYDEWKKQIFIQATIQNIGADRYALLDIPVPPLPDQQRIATYLDTKCSEIDTLITLKRQKIESLNAYKKSVIYEAVTGKTMI